MTARTAVTVIALCASLAGCANQGPPMTPLLAIDPQRCTPRVTGVTPSNLQLEPETSRSVIVDIGPDAPCILAPGGTASLYHAFTLPLTGERLVATVSSLPAGEAMLAPRILLLDGSGNVNREINESAFLFRADALTAIVRLRPEDHMLVVASAPEAVGQAIDRVHEQVQHTIVGVYPVLAQVHTGSEARVQAVMSYTGRVQVVLRKLPSDQTGP